MFEPIFLSKIPEMLQHQSCSLCRLIGQGFYQSWKAAGFDGDMNQVDALPYMSEILPIDDESTTFILHVKARGEPEVVQAAQIDSGFEGVRLQMLIQGETDQIERPAILRPEIPPRADLHFFKEQMRSCERDHQCVHANSQSGQINGLRLIDVTAMCIVRAPENCRYLALSYVWGKPDGIILQATRANISALETKGALLKTQLPKTINNAIQVCEELGEPFLWVDSLCIIQDDSELKHELIDAMDQIYSSAVLTIVAAGGDHADSGLPGVQQVRRTSQYTATVQGLHLMNVLPEMVETVGRSTWNTRGWTYQEWMLSPRCLYFTPLQVYYQCEREAMYEDACFALGTSTLSRQQGSQPRSLDDMYTQVVGDYTQRTLTYQSDIFNAFQGISNLLSRTFDVRFFFGLPDGDFDTALLWQPRGNSKPRVVHGIVLPSWSWVAVEGPVIFKLAGPYEPLVQWSIHSADRHITTISDPPSHNAIDRFNLRDRPPRPHPSTPEAEECRALARLKPGRLIVRAESAFFHLYPSPQEATLVDPAFITVLSIADRHGERAGDIDMDRSWVEANSDRLSLKGAEAEEPPRYEFIALSKVRLYARWFNEPGTPETGPGVNVMLIGWRDNVAHRLGVGRVFLPKWDAAGPTWKNVVLE